MKTACNVFLTLSPFGLILVFLILLLNGCQISDSGQHDCSELTFRFSKYDPNEVFPKISPTEKRNWCGTVEIHIEASHEYSIGLSRLIRLTFHVEANEQCDPVFFISADAIRAGAGLVIEHLTEDGTWKQWAIPYQAWWHDKGQFISLDRLSPADLGLEFQPGYGGDRVERFSFEIWASFRPRSDFSEYGLYRISYRHPWTDMEHTNMHFISKTLYYIHIPRDRANQLFTFMRENPRLDVLAYKFRNPFPSELPLYSRGRYLRLLDKVIVLGLPLEKAMFLLGSPDYILVSDNPDTKWDQEWFYETSPVGGYFVNFNNGQVIRKGFHGDQLSPQGN